MDVEPNLRLRDGTELAVRPIGPEDKGALHAAFHRMSPESRYRRFFSPLTDLSERDLAYLTEIDHHDHEALAAIDPETTGSSGSPGTCGRRRASPRPRSRSSTSGSIAASAPACSSASPHGRREEGITHFVALVLSDNRDAIELFEHFAAGSPHERTRDGQLELLIELPEPGALEGSLLARALREAARGVVTMNPWRVLAEAIRRSWHNRPGR